MPSFSEFTNQYELSKTLRFELKPMGETQRLLEENNVFETDRVIRDKYIKTKKYFDMLHRKFVQGSLQNFSFEASSLLEYEEALREYKKITRETDSKTKKTREKNLQNIEKKLRKEIVAGFDREGKKWATEKFSGLKNKNLKFLDEEGVFESVLLPLYGKNPDGTYTEETTEILKSIDKKTGEVIDEKEISIFEGWKGFTGYFKKFFETRKNFYKDDGTSTAIATRIVNENLRKCFENKYLLEKYPLEFLETLEDKKLELLQNTESFGDFVLQGEKGDFKVGYLGKGIDGYNFVVGQIKKEINLFRQKNKVKIPHLKTLDKQILSPKEKFIEEIEDEAELKTELQNLLKTGNKSVEILTHLFSKFIESNDSFELEKIYWTKKGFETISRKWAFQQTLEWEKSLSKIFKDKTGKDYKKKGKEDGFSFPDFIPVAYLKKSLETLVKNFSGEEIFWKEKYNQTSTTKENIWNQFLQIFWQEFSELLESEKNEKQEGYAIFAKNLVRSLQKEKFEKKEITPRVKLFADNLLWIYQFAKYFSLDKKERWNSEHRDEDSHFYEEYKTFFSDSYENIVQPYNRLRNYLTKKPWEEVQRWKLNFENGSDFLGGWDQNQEMKKYGTLLEKDGKYFLAIFKKKYRNNIFRQEEKNSWSSKIPVAYDLTRGEPFYKKLEYKLIADPSKDISLLLARASKENLEKFNPSEEILRIKKEETFKKGVNFNLKDLHTLIDYYKSAIPKYRNWEIYDFNFSDTSKYKTIYDFTEEIAKSGYKVWFENISEKYIEEKNKNGELYLFQIKNKDWNEGVKKGAKKNLHTLYFENLFSSANTKENFLLKMNGGAEVFHRPKTSKEKLGMKKDNSGKDVVNHKRYNRDTTFFHLPITFNRGTGKITPFQFNQKTNEFLANNPDVKILGIDRGEKYLAYFSLITQEGKILDSGSLNIMGGKDYHYELEKRAKNREEQRKNWQAVDDIKNLKKGYISLVVHRLAKLAIEHNAIIVFEDLNMRFKQIRGGIEKSAYQQLEKALLDKLSFCVDKSKNPNDVGGVLKAHQLTAPVEAFKDMGKQTGMIFYTTASYTSKIDPVTGWRPHLYIKYESVEKTSKLLKEKLDSIEWNAEKNRFEFVYTHGEKQWRLCSSVERWRGFRSEKSNNQWDYQKFPTKGEGSITEKLLELFENENIDIQNSILDQLCISKSATLLKEIVKYFRLINQIRNTNGILHEELQKLKTLEKFDAQNPEISEKIFDEDFILSPVEGENGFFDSRCPEKFGENLPKNGDDNGAYNIARKGQILLQRISEWGNLSDEEKQKKNPELFVSNDEWDAFCINNYFA